MFNCFRLKESQDGLPFQEGRKGNSVFVFVFVFIIVFVFVCLIVSDLGNHRMGRRFKKEGKGKKKSGGKLSQEDLDYLAKNTSMSEESIQEFYQVIGAQSFAKTSLCLRNTSKNSIKREIIGVGHVVMLMPDMMNAGVQSD